MKYATDKQIRYIRDLRDKLEAEDSNVMVDVLKDLNVPENQDFSDWLRRQSAQEASKIIEYLLNIS